MIGVGHGGQSIDARRRELEQRVLRTGSAEDVSALLRERLRAGDVPVEGLELAAYLGHGPAAVALGEGAPAPLTAGHLPSARLPLERITAATAGPLSLLGRRGDEVCMRVAIAAALHARAAWGRVRSDRARADRADACLRAAERWVLGDVAARRHGLIGPWPEDEGPLAQALQGLFHLASAGKSPRESRERARTTYLARTLAAAARAAATARDAEPRERAALLEAVRAEVAPWALGELDPLRLRHAAR